MKIGNLGRFPFFVSCPQGRGKEKGKSLRLFARKDYLCNDLSLAGRIGGRCRRAERCMNEIQNHSEQL